MTRLLFVDDEQKLLDGLRLSLRSKRKEWDMVFVASPAAALRELANGTFDVVVSDMRMPELDGAELLQRVQELQPEAFRIVLSGQMDESAALRAAATAHRFVAKPCNSHTLERILGDALALHQSIRTELLHCAGALTGLPSPAETCASLTRVLGRKDCTLADVMPLIVGDVGLSARVLQLVNSGFFGLPHRIASVEQAANYLGLDALRGLSRAGALCRELGPAEASAFAAVRARSLLAARYAGMFVLDDRTSAVAVTAALLRNVGPLALLSCAEGKAIHGVAAEVSASLLRLWGLPDEVVAAASHHDIDWETLPALHAGAVVELANLLTDHALGEGPGALARPLVAALTRLRVPETILQVLRSAAA